MEPLIVVKQQAGFQVAKVDGEGRAHALPIGEGEDALGPHARAIILGINRNDSKDTFESGEAAMLVNGPWAIDGVAAKNPDLNLHVRIPLFRRFGGYYDGHLQCGELS